MRLVRPASSAERRRCIQMGARARQSGGGEPNVESSGEQEGHLWFAEHQHAQDGVGLTGWCRAWDSVREGAVSPSPHVKA